MHRSIIRTGVLFVQIICTYTLQRFFGHLRSICSYKLPPWTVNDSYFHSPSLPLSLSPSLPPSLPLSHLQPDTTTTGYVKYMLVSGQEAPP